MSGLMNQWTRSLHLPTWLPFGCRICYAIIINGFLSQDPAQPLIFSAVRQSPGFISSITPIFYAAFPATTSVLRMSVIILLGSYSFPVLSRVYMILKILQAITIRDCIFFSGFSSLLV